MKSGKSMYQLSERDLWRLISHYRVAPLSGSPLERIEKWLLMDNNVDENRLAMAMDPISYFETHCDEMFENFLNDTERCFFLQHGFGIPDQYISLANVEIRQRILRASRSATIALTDVVSASALWQDPDDVRNHLIGMNPSTIDPWHLDMMDELTKNYDDAIASIGVLPIVTFNPITDALESGVAELSLYRHVINDKTWAFEDVDGKGSENVDKILSHLPDSELLRVSSPFGCVDDDTSTLSRRLRSFLVEKARRHLTKVRMLSVDGGFCFASPIHASICDVFTLEMLDHAFQQHDALIAPDGTAVMLNDAKQLFDLGVDIGELLERVKSQSSRSDTVWMWTEVNGNWTPLGITCRDFIARKLPWNHFLDDTRRFQNISIIQAKNNP